MRISRAAIGIFALLVDAKDDIAAGFWLHHGFTILPGEERRMVLPVATALDAVRTARPLLP